MQRPKRPKQPPRFYVLTVMEDTEPMLSRPHRTALARDRDAWRTMKVDPECRNGVYRLDLDEAGVLRVAPYHGGFRDGAEPSAPAKHYRIIQGDT